MCECRGGSRTRFRLVRPPRAPLRPHQRAAAQGRAGPADRLIPALLRTRVITAVIVLLVLVGMLFFASALVWSLFVLAVALAACWEWSRLASLAPRGQAVYLFLSRALGACFSLLYARVSDRALVPA